MMATYAIDSDEAFAVLRRHSQHWIIKVRELAARLTEQLIAPQTADLPPRRRISEILADIADTPTCSGRPFGVPPHPATPTPTPTPSDTKGGERRHAAGSGELRRPAAADEISQMRCGVPGRFDPAAGAPMSSTTDTGLPSPAGRGPARSWPVV